MITKTVNEDAFINEFGSYGRVVFTHDALVALYEYLVDHSKDTGEPVELDVVRFADEFTEYENFEEIQKAYSSTKLETIEDLWDNTQVIEFNNGIIIQDF